MSYCDKNGINQINDAKWLNYSQIKWANQIKWKAFQVLFYDTQPNIEAVRIFFQRIKWIKHAEVVKVYIFQLLRLL